ncbi:NAD(P)H-dependent oxidoreductase, partial [Escherichia coli]
QDGYNIKEEQDTFLWADVVIYQTPIYWFSVPGLFKTYMDEVYEYGLFFKGADEYGTGGLLTNDIFYIFLLFIDGYYGKNAFSEYQPAVNRSKGSELFGN